PPCAQWTRTNRTWKGPRCSLIAELVGPTAAGAAVGIGWSRGADGDAERLQTSHQMRRLDQRFGKEQARLGAAAARKAEQGLDGDGRTACAHSGIAFWINELIPKPTGLSTPALSGDLDDHFIGGT